MNFTDPIPANLQLASPQFDSLANFHNEMLQAVKGCQHKEVDQLTEYERFALAFGAGVGLTSRMDHNGKIIFTTERCGITKIDGKFRVYVEPPDKTPRVRFREERR